MAVGDLGDLGDLGGELAGDAVGEPDLPGVADTAAPEVGALAEAESEVESEAEATAEAEAAEEGVGLGRSRSHLDHRSCCLALRLTSLARPAHHSQ